MVWGGWGDAEKSYASMSVEFELFGRDKSQKETHKSIFEFLTLLTRHRFFFFVPETPHLLFFNAKRRAPENGSKSAPSKVDLEPYGAIWCQFGCQFSSPKTKNSS